MHGTQTGRWRVVCPYVCIYMRRWIGRKVPPGVDGNVSRNLMMHTMSIHSRRYVFVCVENGDARRGFVCYIRFLLWDRIVKHMSLTPSPIIIFMETVYSLNAVATVLGFEPYVCIHEISF